MKIKDENSFPIEISDYIMENLRKIKLFSPETILEKKLYDNSITYSMGVIMVIIFTQEGFLPDISNFDYFSILKV